MQAVTTQSSEQQVLHHPQLPHLCGLMTNLAHRIEQRDPLLVKIKNPRKLLSSLLKLYNMVGQYEIKEAIAKQTTYLIKKLEKGKNNLKMLNTVILGNPGVGKTLLGIILAEIWYHLGFLEHAKKQKDSKQSIMSKFNANQIEAYLPYLIAAVYLYIIFSKLYSDNLLPLYEKYSHIVNYFIIGFITSFFLGLLYFYRIQSPDPSSSEPQESDIITITSRSDFVSGYVGWSDKKTEELLRNNRGKVIFIDEAYSLYSGYQDQYGAEALNKLKI